MVWCTAATGWPSTQQMLEAYHCALNKTYIMFVCIKAEKMFWFTKAEDGPLHPKYTLDGPGLLCAHGLTP